MSSRGSHASEVAERAVRTLRLIAHRRALAAEIAAEVRCTTRQVYRILHAIEQTGVEVEHDRHDGWWIRRAALMRWIST